MQDYQGHVAMLACGSMQRGQRRPWSTAMAFSEEKSSLGRPQMFHCLILTGSPRAVERLNFGLQGTPAAWQAPTQVARQSALCTDVNGPVRGRDVSEQWKHQRLGHVSRSTTIRQHAHVAWRRVKAEKRPKASTNKPRHLGRAVSAPSRPSQSGLCL